ncbi:hypothetical protein [Sphingomonas hankyongi]|uniref:Uncharacterized protein n=1 Tax=Sphingomonas hankyongi TaxID=2908209 RepID=A0ABT0S234_9SPHN|nr:hypothetical protein [Sphingomonas hankyongi]MCL6729925.1 hypothetical protein [Sphingomonas hankyongi]
MADAAIVDATLLVRTECLPENRDAARESRRPGSELLPRVAGMMIATTSATFITLVGGYSLLF